MSNNCTNEGALHLRLVGMPGVTFRSVTLLACRSQSLRSAVNRAMLTGAVSGTSGPSVVMHTPSATSSVLSEAVYSPHQTK